MAKQVQNDIYSFLKNVSERYMDRPAFFGRQATADGGHTWSALTYRDVLEQSEKLARKLLALGLQKGDRVLLLAKSRPEYSVGFFAIPLAGGIIVPVDIRLSLPDQKFISEFSEARFILCMNDETRAIGEKIVQNSAQSLCVLNINEVMTENSANTADLTLTSRPSDETFLMAFTSGTTSQPKAVMLNFESVYYQVALAGGLFSSKKDFRLLSILPLHHMFEITAGFLLPFNRGGSVYYANSLIPHQIISFFKENKIRDLLVVPLFLRTLKKGIESEINSSALKRIWFYSTLRLARFIPSKRLRRLLFYPLHRKFGGELHQIISGASALDLKVGHFFDLIGVSVFEGYGMTETAPVISCSSPGVNKPGSIGKALEGIEVKLHPETQEILVRGPIVMQGYFKNPEATAACLSSEGWFNTGDVGEIDAEGFIMIKGRNKDLIVLGSGKKVAPEEIEESLREVPNVQEICVLGLKSSHGATKGTEIVTAVVVVNPADASMQEQIQKTLHQATMQLSYYKRPSKFIFLTEPLPKTTTLKVKKNLVKELLIKQRITV
jgi:long-chain acyl-CoA synthetase